MNSLPEYLETELLFVNPCLGKQGTGNNLICVLVHVDDVMFTGRQVPVSSFVKKLKEKFDVEISMVKNYNGEFSFLKRKYAYVPEGLLVRPGQYATKMIKAFRHCGASWCLAIYRSIVGMDIYLAQERLDISFVVKELASKMASPTGLSMQNPRGLVG